MTRVLILGGTSEALDLANRMCDVEALEPIYSLAGRTLAPALPRCEVRRGGFGGVEQLSTYLSDARIDVVIDATHPYASHMASNALAGAKAAGVAHCKLLRPPWSEPEDAPWLHAASPKAAAGIIEDRFERIFISSGLGDVAAFAHLTGSWFLIRTIEEPSNPVPLASFTLIRDRGPFELGAEKALLGEHRVDALVSKNSGGEATSAKLEAAQQMGIAIIMIERPPIPDCDLYGDAQSLIDRLF
jgi:precorrin-6A/cobalt-precorrin-6A reductase